MSSPPLDICVRVENLASLGGNDIVIPYKIDSDFSLGKLFYLIGKELFPCDNRHDINHELVLVQFRRDLFIKFIDFTGKDYASFIPGTRNLTATWETDGYVMKNQDSELIKLYPDKKYILVIRKKSIKNFIVEIEKNEQVAAVDQLENYRKIANYFDLKDEVYLKIKHGISNLTKEFYAENSFDACPFATILGPSLMGKTQFAFVLAREFPVFYINFDSRYHKTKTKTQSQSRSQLIYSNFESISFQFSMTLLDDLSTLERNCIDIHSDLLPPKFLQLLLKIDLKIIGLIWELIVYSTKFKNECDWFDYYLKKRTFIYESMSLSDYYDKLSSNQTKFCHFLLFFLESLVIEEKSFVPPILCIDENVFDGKVKMLRNFARILGLRCVMASKNTLANNISNPETENYIWVHTIKTLPKANFDAILHELNLMKYADNSGELNVNNLLADLKITFDDGNLKQLQNLVRFMTGQTETCLQGIALIVFSTLKEQLEKQSELNVPEIWETILSKLYDKLLSSNHRAFNDENLFYTLNMLGGDGRDIFASYNETSLKTINEHFYYFGQSNDPEIMNFCYRDYSLTLNKIPYCNCSHFKLFKDDAFLCLAMWSRIDINQSSVASIISKYYHCRHNPSRNINSLKNNTSAQETAIYDSICCSSLKNVHGFNPAYSFLKNFVTNIQIDKKHFDQILHLPLPPHQTKYEGFNGKIDFESCANLEEFLNDINVPHLIPSEIICNDINSKLDEFYKIGACKFLPPKLQIDIEFDLFYKNQAKKGYVECKYYEKNLSKVDVLKYVNRAKKLGSPFSMLVTFTMRNCLKSAYLWNKNFNVEESNELGSKVTKLEMKKEIENEKNQLDNVSIYSIFYEKCGMIAIPLVEVKNPSLVFLVVQTNFLVPKI